MNYGKVVEEITRHREEIAKLFEGIEHLKNSSYDVIDTEIGGLKFRIQVLKDHKKDIKKA